MNEHLSSKSHIALAKKNEENLKSGNIKKEETKKNQPEITTLQDVTVCLLCNKKHENLEDNIIHMIEIHNLYIPLKSSIKRPKGFIKLLADKIFKYNACLFCDCQNFSSYKAVQNHMVIIL
jgi:pre-60S factor REI1